MMWLWAARPWLSLLVRGAGAVALALLAIICAPSISIADEDVPGDLSHRIVVLHSYHPGFTWTDEEHAGIMDVLWAKQPGAEPHVEYMDWKRYPTAAHLKKLTALYTSKYAEIDIDVVITTDDAALGYAIENRPGLWPNAAIVFCGLNKYEPEKIAAAGNVTGVLELVDPVETLKLALKLHPGRQRLVGIFDTTESGLAASDLVRQELDHFYPSIQDEFIQSLPMKDLLARVEELPSDSIILLGNFNRDSTGATFSHEQTLALIKSKTALPIYGLWAFLIDEGIVGGSLLSGKTHGAAAAEMALSILDGITVDKLPVQREIPTVKQINYKELARLGIPKSAVPPDYEVINMPDRTKQVIITSQIMMVVLMCIVIYLVADQRQRRRAAREIRRSERRFHAIFDNAGNGIALVDAGGTILDSNRALSEFLGLSGVSLNARAVLDLVHRDDVALTRQLFQRVFEGESGTHSIKRRFLRNDGEIVWGALTLTAVKSAHGKLDFAVVMITDITQQVRAEEAQREQQQRLRTLIDSMPDIVCFKDSNGRWLEANAFDLKLFQLEGVNYRNLKDSELAAFSPFYSAAFQTCEASDEKAWAAGSMSRGEEIIPRPDGTEMVFDIIKVPVFNPDGSRKGLVVIGRDITERTRAIQEIHRLNEELEERVRVRTTELAQANDELTTANKELEAYSMMISHDLRSPARKTAGLAQIILQDYSAILPPAAIDLLQRIYDHAIRLHALLSDLLVFSQFNRAPLSKSQIDTVNLVNKVLQEFNQERDERNVAVTVGDLPPCMADPSLLRQVFANLISNAFKYSRDREQAKIEIGAAQHGAQTVYYVRDNGVGFDPSQKNKLFKVFQRLDNADKYEGTGVGLAIVDRIIQRHGGRIWADSLSGHGTTFYFTV